MNSQTKIKNWVTLNLSWLKTKSAYHFSGKLGNSRENSNGTVRPGGNFPEKKVIPLEVLASSSLRKHPFLLALPHLQSQKKAPWRRGWILAL